MDIALRQPRSERRVERFGPEPGTRAGQRPDFAVERLVPGVALDPRGEHAVEDMRACRGKQDRTLLAIHPVPPEHGTRLRDIAPLAAKALFAEIIGHAACG